MSLELGLPSNHVLLLGIQLTIPLVGRVERGMGAFHARHVLFDLERGHALLHMRFGRSIQGFLHFCNLIDELAFRHGNLLFILLYVLYMLNLTYYFLFV